MALLDGRILFPVVLVAALAGHPACAQAEAATTEDEIKAAYLFNFARFVEWPPRSQAGDAALVIGVFDRDGFAATLEIVVRDKTVNGRRLLVKRLTVPQDSRVCHIVFIAAAHRRLLREVFEAANLAGVLTVGESDHFARSGGMINFIKDANRIRFEINVDATARAGLRVSSRLLQLARVVHEEAAAR